MTREETTQFLPIFKAYSEGKTIQFRDSANNWHDFEQETVLIFDGDVNNYRVKPSEVENEVKINKELQASLVFLMTKLDSVKSESKLLKDDNLVNSLSEVLRYFKRNGELKEAYKEIYVDMFKDTLYQEYAESATERGDGIGIAKMLYEQMKRNYDL